MILVIVIILLNTAVSLFGFRSIREGEGRKVLFVPYDEHCQS